MSNIARTLREREQAFEAHYQLDAELNFRIRARRDRLFGQWVASKLGLVDRAAEEYALQLPLLNLEEAGDENVIRKIKQDLELADVAMDDLIISERLGICHVQAMEELRNQYPHALGHQSLLDAKTH